MLKLKRKDWPWLALSGLLGTFFPAFLFAYAQTEIDSAISAILNSTVPLITLILGAVLFGISFSKRQLLGVIIGLSGAVGLVLAGMEQQSRTELSFRRISFDCLLLLCE